MPSITSERVNYLVWRYLQEEGLALSGFTLDKETHASQWASEFRDSTADGQLVKLLLKGIQMLEIEQAQLPAQVPIARTDPLNLELVEPPAPLTGGFTAALPFKSAGPGPQVLLVGGPDGTAAYTLPELAFLGPEAFAAAEAPTFIESPAARDTVFIGYDNGTVRGWGLRPESSTTELQYVLMLPSAEHAPITGLKRAPSGQLLASIDVRNVVALWNLETRTLVSEIAVGGPDSGLLADAVWVTDSMLAVLQPDALAVYNVGDTSPKKIFAAPRASQLAFDSVSRLLVSGSDDGLVCLWSSNNDEPYQVIRDHRGPITYVGWVSDTPISQPLLLTASTDGWLKLWRLDDTQAVETANAGDPVFEVCLSEKYIAALTKQSVKVYTRGLALVAEYFHEGVQGIALHEHLLIIAAKSGTSVFKIGPN